MNRKAFLQQSSLAVAVAAGLPRAVRTAVQNSRYIYQSLIIDQKKKGKLQYIITVYHTAVKSLSYAADLEKEVFLKINYFEDDLSTPASTAEIKYLMTAAKQTNAATDTWKVTAKYDSTVAGEYKPAKNFLKELSLSIQMMTSATILGSKNKAIATLPYYSSYTPSSGSGGCFLTTACVEHHNLADDCEELTTLRSLRDNHMLHTLSGQQQVQQYYQAGPAIVAAINRCENRADIYDYMYREMILPSVALVKEKRFDEAVAHYSVFVEALHHAYCN